MGPWHLNRQQCFVLMVVWILIFLMLLYRILINNPEPVIEIQKLISEDLKVEMCNLPNELRKGDEGNQSRKWHLKGLFIIIRHGDRGPLQHIRNISNLNCDYNGEEEQVKFTLYKSFISNIIQSGKAWWMASSSNGFHGIPPIPLYSNQCQLGQLTIQGIKQLLVLGDLLQKSYKNHLDIIKHVFVYSTRYRRTFQSVLALLYGLVPNNRTNNVKFYLNESPSMYFCFTDCACPLKDKLSKVIKSGIKRDKFMEKTIRTTGMRLFSKSVEKTIIIRDAFAVYDGLLAYLCHNGTQLLSAKIETVEKILDYVQWLNEEKQNKIVWKKVAQLRSYGMIKHLVQQILFLISTREPNLIIYSGHDRTLEQLVTTFGLTFKGNYLKYASRFIIEILQNHQNTTELNNIYFRLLINGDDVTTSISFYTDEEAGCKESPVIGHERFYQESRKSSKRKKYRRQLTKRSKSEAEFSLNLLNVARKRAVYSGRSYSLDRRDIEEIPEIYFGANSCLSNPNRYEFQGDLKHCGTLKNKHWFIVQDVILKAERVFTIVKVKTRFSTDGRDVLLKLLQNLQHPYIYPIFDLGLDPNTICVISPLNLNGSLKDLIYNTTTNHRGIALPMDQIQYFGRQILEGLLFLYGRQMPPYPHLHSGNILIQNGVARLGDLEGFFYKTSTETNLNLQFGNLLFEMATGYCLKQPPTVARLQLELETVPKILQVLILIYANPYEICLKTLTACECFRWVELRELRGIPSVPKNTITPEIQYLINYIQK